MPELFFRMKYSKTDSSYYDRDLVPRTQVEIVKAVSHDVGVKSTLHLILVLWQLNKAMF